MKDDPKVSVVVSLGISMGLEPDAGVSITTEDDQSAEAFALIELSGLLYQMDAALSGRMPLGVVTPGQRSSLLVAIRVLGKRQFGET